MAGPTQRGRAKRTKEKRERDKQAGRGGFGKKGGEKHQKSLQQLLNEERAIHESLISPVSDTIRSETYKGGTSEFSPHGFGDASTLYGSTSTNIVGDEQPRTLSKFQTPHMAQIAFLNPNTMYSFPHVEAPGQIWNSITRTFEPWDPGLTGAADYRHAYRFPEEIEALKDEFSGLGSFYPDNDLMQMADVSRSDINTMKMFPSSMTKEQIESLGGTFSPEFTDQDFKDIREGIITSPTGIFSAQL